MENTRFHPGEEKNDPAFVAQLAKLGDIFVNDAFSVSHRAHASTEGLAHLLPAYAGRTLQAELEAFEKVLDKPARPLAAIVGGAKISTKLDLLGHLLQKVDVLIIGGAMANTFLLAQGKKVGKSLVEADLVETARKIMAEAKTAKREIVLPVDAVVAEKFEANAPSRVVDVDHVGDNEMILDIGPRSIEQVVSVLARSKTLVWNGPFGAFEMEPFDNGTVEVAEAAAELTAAGKLVSVAGGGDTVAALNVAGVADRLTYVSTAGGAFLEWLEGKALPGVEVLRVKLSPANAILKACERMMEGKMNLAELNKVALAMVAPGKGILAADESSGTIKKRFDAIGVESTEDARRDYREMLFRSADGMKHISGVILYDETIWQKAKDGTPLVDLIKKAGALPGIKVDEGVKPLPNCPGEVVTIGLDKLADRLPKYYEQGARFAKWRAVIDIGAGIPTHTCIFANAHALARYAALCQQAQIVPIVEPEVLMDGGHDIDTCVKVTEWTLKETFQQLYYNKVALEGMVLKPNMAISGKKCAKRAGVEEVAEKTVKMLKECVPGAVPGIAFLSGGQSDEEATAHLDAMNRIGNLPWKLTFSYGRALQHAPQTTWRGKT